MIIIQFPKQVKVVRTNNGNEFKFSPMKSFYREKGITHQTTCVDMPQQNGRVERKHRHVLNVARALRFQDKLPLSFWSECVLTKIYLINRMPNKLLNGKIPYEVLFQKRLLMVRIGLSVAYAMLKSD